MKTYESFSDEEKELLAPFVTNTDKPIFVLTHLPEVIKGALFSRYSRSTLGLRRLLLKEFIQNEESEFQKIQGGGESGSEAQSSSFLAIERAQNFYDRILDGYGDDSIGELGGAHLAVENSSILASKFLEDCRIGGSPLEKSTRYVTFGKKVDGEYLFYREPRLLNSRFRDQYLEINNYLFDTYSDFIEPIREHVASRMPREEGISDAAYQRSVRAKGFDVIRGLLPASTLTNLGIFGNGRFFETFISKMRLSPLQELQDVAQTTYDELSKVIPSFVRRAEGDHRHFESYKKFMESGRSTATNFAKSHLASVTAADAQPVQLVDYSSDAEIHLITALLYPYSPLPYQQLKELIEELPDSDLENLLLETIDSREHRRHKPGRFLEMPTYTFDILGDYGMYRDLQRHRILTQERQPLSPHFGYITPEEIEDAGLGERYHEAMKRAADAYQEIYQEFPHEAQYVVPLSYNIRWFVRINLRALMWLVELRSTPQGHESYRKAAQQMFEQVKAVQPLLAKYMKFVDLNEYSLGRLNAENRLEQKRE